MNTTALKRFAQQARVILKEGVQAQLTYWGFDTKGKITATPEEVSGGVNFRGKMIDDPSLFKKWNALRTAVATHGFQHIAEEAAYTWFNRLMAIQILAKNDYIRPQLAFESANIQTPLIVANARRGQLPTLTAEERLQLEDLLIDDSAETEQFRLLITAFCRSTLLLNRVFGRMDDYTELLLPINILSPNGFVALLNNDTNISDADYHEVELIGWLYQFYISEKKDEVFKSFKNKKKAEAEDIPAATQIFTPNWIVKYMVQNTVGRLWLDLNPDSPLLHSMNYLVENPDAEAARSEPLVAEVSEIKLLDPACGSGHILVEGFDLLFEMYTEEGYTPRQAVREILRNNLYGLDIDLRAAQLANFAILLKAAAKDASILDEDITPHIYAMPEPLSFSPQCVRIFLGEETEYDDTLQKVLLLMKQAQNLGSVMKITISPEMRQTLKTQLAYWEKRKNAVDLFLQEEFLHLFPYIRIILLLTDQYEAVAANPPYMGSGNMNGELKEYVAKNYPKSKADLFAVFMEKSMELCAENGRMGMINMHSWMFLSSFEALRKEIIEGCFIENMLHLGPRTFDELSGEVVQNTAFVLKHTSKIGLGVYYRLVDGGNCREKEQMFLKDNGRFAHISQSNFEKIPGSPVAYWVSERVIATFSFDAINHFAETRIGLVTGDNEYYIRNWNEVEFRKIEFHSSLNNKWYPQSKGGEYRKWYGNNTTVLNWSNDGFELLHRMHSSGKRTLAHNFNLDKKFNKGITWSKISSGSFGTRVQPEGFLFNDASANAFLLDDGYFLYLLGFLNTNIAKILLKALNPTLNFLPGNIESLPLIIKEKSIIDLHVSNSLTISRLDWDSREISWDFQRNELIRQEQPTIESAYAKYLHYWTVQFTQLHCNEVELNRIFIDIYGLQEELTPEVKLKDVTILQEELDYSVLGEKTEMEDLPDRERLPLKGDEAMRQLISYAIGCMMGRYRLDRPGMHIAHPNPTDEEIGSYPYNGETFSIDDDAIIPLMDSSCSFADNALFRLKAFVRQVWSHNTEIENINFIERSLGKDLESYLVKDFWKDHCRRYQKRPIYWLFASPKGAFRVIVYMHRMNKYTVEKIRNNYLLKHIQNLESRRAMLEAEIALDSAGKRTLDKVIKDLEECRAYDFLLKDVADQQITFDLDDGVVVNYAKFGDVVEKIK